MRPDKSRSSRRALCRREFDSQFKMICSLNRRSSLGFSDVCGNSGGFLNPFSWPAGNCTLRMLLWLAERSERFVSRRLFCNLCLHRRLEACRRSRRLLDRRSAAKGLFFACHQKFPFEWLISRIVLAISSISGLQFHRGELQTVGSLVEKLP